MWATLPVSWSVMHLWHNRIDTLNLDCNPSQLMYCTVMKANEALWVTVALSDPVNSHWIEIVLIFPCVGCLESKGSTDSTTVEHPTKTNSAIRHKFDVTVCCASFGVGKEWKWSNANINPRWSVVFVWATIRGKYIKQELNLWPVQEWINIILWVIYLVCLENWCVELLGLWEKANRISQVSAPSLFSSWHVLCLTLQNPCTQDRNNCEHTHYSSQGHA